MDFSLSAFDESDEEIQITPGADNASSTKFDDLPHDIMLRILFFNLDHKEAVRMKSLNKEYYELLNPNDPVVNMMWECITRHAFPFMASILKCKRWDLYFKFRAQQL